MNKLKPVKYAPVQLQQRAKAWLELHRLGTTRDGSNDISGVAIVCFLFAVEFYLKSFLVYLDSKFASGDELESLGHNFNSIFSEISKRADKSLTQKIKNKLVSLNLFNIDPVTLRYPSVNTMMTYSIDLWNGQHSFDNLFEALDQEIRGNVLTHA